MRHLCVSLLLFIAFSAAALQELQPRPPVNETNVQESELDKPLEDWLNGIARLVSCKNTLAEDLLLKQLDLWKQAVLSLSELGGTRKESELKFSTAEQKMLKLLRKALQDQPLLKERDIKHKQAFDKFLLTGKTDENAEYYEVAAELQKELEASYKKNVTKAQ